MNRLEKCHPNGVALIGLISRTNLGHVQFNSHFLVERGMEVEKRTTTPIYSLIREKTHIHRADFAASSKK